MVIMEIKDITGFEKPLTKLIEVVSEGIGIVYADTVGVNAEVRRREKIAEVEQRIEIMQIDTNIEVANRIRQRLITREIRRQENIDETVREAADFLPASVSETKPDPDWTTAFFNIAQDISSEDMRTLWAKILAGEVTKPGTYSRRTLEILKNLSSSEAKNFQRLHSFIFGHYVVFKLTNESNSLSAFGVHHVDWKMMHEAQLFASAEDLRITISSGPSPWFTVGNRKIKFQSESSSPIVVQIKQLTDVGVELSRLITNVIANENYLEALKDHFKKQGVVVTIENS